MGTTNLKKILSGFPHILSWKTQAKNVTQSVKGNRVIAKSRRVLGRQKTKSANVNEDYRLIDRENNLYIIADGLGGHRAGEDASRIAVTEVANRLSRFIHGFRDGLYQEDEIEDRIGKAVEYANDAIMCPLASASEYLKSFGTTIDALFYRNSKAYIAHVGDSRVYLYRAEKLMRLTEDDHLIGSDSGLLSQYLGKKGIRVHTTSLPIQDQDIILMATDGLTDLVHDEEISDILAINDFDDVPSELVYRANHPIRVAELYAESEGININQARKGLGGKDNITLILLKFKEG